MTSLKMENSTFTSELDRSFSIWNSAVHHVSFWVCAAGTCTEQLQILVVSTQLSSTTNYFSKMINMLDEIVFSKDYDSIGFGI